MRVGSLVKYDGNAKIYWAPEEDAIGIIIYGGDTQYRVKWNDGCEGWYIPSDLEVICN